MTAVSTSVRNAVLERDTWRCVICQTTDALQVHHRSGRRMGGSKRPEIAALSNLLTLCLTDHATTEAHKNDGRDNGWLVSQFADPATVPVVWHGRTVPLLDDGTVQDVTPEWLA